MDNTISQSQQNPHAIAIANPNAGPAGSAPAVSQDHQVYQLPPPPHSLPHASNHAQIASHIPSQQHHHQHQHFNGTNGPLDAPQFNQQQFPPMHIRQPQMMGPNPGQMNQQQYLPVFQQHHHHQQHPQYQELAFQNKNSPMPHHVQPGMQDHLPPQVLPQPIPLSQHMQGQAQSQAQLQQKPRRKQPSSLEITPPSNSPSNAPNQTATHPPPPSRSAAAYPRKRALTACDTCRLKKIKCDNVRPRCGACTRNGYSRCNYRVDHVNDYSNFDPASLNILNKLDTLMKDVKSLKNAKRRRGDDEDDDNDNDNDDEGEDDDESDAKIQSPATHKSKTQKSRKLLRKFKFDKCIWDMSLTSVLHWPFLQNTLQVSQDEINTTVGTLIGKYSHTNYYQSPTPTTFKQRVGNCQLIEQILATHFSNFINSFFLNSHTKIPIFDVLELLESIEIYKIMKNTDPSLTFISIKENQPYISEDDLDRYINGYDKSATSTSIDDQFLPPLYFQALQNQTIKDTAYRRRAYLVLCQSLPLILLICALGVIATPVQLDNMGQFVNSTQELESIDNSCMPKSEVPPGLPESRFAISQYLLNYATMIHQLFPSTLPEGDLSTVEYYVLLNQYHLSIMNPLKAYGYISKACHVMIYFLELHRRRADSVSRVDIAAGGQESNKKQIIDRLFWTCLRLESELRVELSPFVPLSGITQVVPSISFPKIPEPISEDDLDSGHHSRESVLLANKFDDSYSWYYFLTEIAVRKVDSSMFDEVFSHESVLQKTWSSPQFAQEDIWRLFIKYLNQYNGIINSLSPRIRNFVLQEVEVEEIYKSMKKKYHNKMRSGSNFKVELDIFDALDDFLVDDDLLVKAQSESVMFIKTRILTSKFVLFRPIIYLVLHDQIGFDEIIEAAMTILPLIKQAGRPSNGHNNNGESNNGWGASPAYSSGSSTQMNHPEPANAANPFDLQSNPADAPPNLDSSSGGDADPMDLNYYQLLNAPLRYQEQHPDEDFSHLIEYENNDVASSCADGSDENQGNVDVGSEIRLKDVKTARKQVLHVFFLNLIKLPKLNIPKLAAHRHPGSWYYLRNLFIGTIYQFLLYKKIQQMIIRATTDVSLMAKINSQLPDADGKGDGLKRIIEVIDSVISKESTRALLDYTLIIFNYWKDESKDCVIYHEYIQKCIGHL